MTFGYLHFVQLCISLFKKQTFNLYNRSVNIKTPINTDVYDIICIFAGNAVKQKNHCNNRRYQRYRQGYSFRVCPLWR
jgi:hypothetical protein